MSLNHVNMLKVAVSVPPSNLSFYRPVMVFIVFSHWALMAMAAKHPEVSSRRSCSLVSAAQLLASSYAVMGGMYNQSVFVDTKEGMQFF